MDLYVFQRLLTHKGPVMTQRYAHLQDATLKAASAIGEGQLSKGQTYRVNLEDLLIFGELDTAMAKWCLHRLADGAVLILLSDRGKEYARTETRRLGVESLFMW